VAGDKLQGKCHSHCAVTFVSMWGQAHKECGLDLTMCSAPTPLYKLSIFLNCFFVAPARTYAAAKVMPLLPDDTSCGAVILGHTKKKSLYHGNLNLHLPKQTNYPARNTVLGKRPKFSDNGT